MARKLEQMMADLPATRRAAVEAMGGKLELVAQFPDRAPMVIDHLTPSNSRSNRPLAGQVEAK